MEQVNQFISFEFITADSQTLLTVIYSPDAGANIRGACKG